MLILKDTESERSLYFSDLAALREFLTAPAPAPNLEEICRGVLAGNWMLVLQHLDNIGSEDMPHILQALHCRLAAKWPAALILLNEVDTQNSDTFKTGLCIICSAAFKHFTRKGS
jgi:hypothetical protein